MNCTRRTFWAAVPGICHAAGRGSLMPSAVHRYSDPTTELPVNRLTDPEHSSRLPAHYTRCISKRGSFLLYSSDQQVYRLDTKTGQSRQLTEARSLDPMSVTLTADERSFCYFDSG